MGCLGSKQVDPIDDYTFNRSGPAKNQYKVVLLGETGCGKTALFQRIMNDEYIDGDHEPTVGAFFGTKIINLGKVEVKLGIWDTAGQEKFHSLGEIYYRNSDVCLLVFDVTERASFLKMDIWYKELKGNLGDKVTIIIIGNKTDKEIRMVPTEEAKAYASDRKCQYIETSCKTGQYIPGLINLLEESVTLKYNTN